MAGVMSNRTRGLLSGGKTEDKFRRVPGAKTRVKVEYGGGIGQRE